MGEAGEGEVIVGGVHSFDRGGGYQMIQIDLSDSENETENRESERL